MRRMLSAKSLVAVIAFFLAMDVAGYSAAGYLKQFTFDDAAALDTWAKMILHGKVDYTLMKVGPNGYVQAVSEKACSALYYRVAFKAADYPYLSWKWQVIKFPDKSQAFDDKAKNDYAARMYVIFPFLSFSSSKFIEYVWTDDAPAGTVIDSPDGKNIKMIVVRSDPAGGDWYRESRNVYEDYLKAFGEQPKLKVGAVAMMCDADNTKSEAESLFDEIAIASQE